MGTKEKAKRKNGKISEDRTRNIENTIVITKNSIVVITENDRITTSILDTENAPMTSIVITVTIYIEGIGMTITVIGAPGITGTDMQEDTRIYTNMEAITAKVGI
jgi:hypothetical protein